MHARLAAFTADAKRWGLGKAFYRLLMLGLERHPGIHVFVVQARLLNPNAPREPLPANCQIRRLSREELYEQCRNPALDISAAFIDQALARGDRCTGYLEDGRLVSYVWTGVSATPMEAGLWVRFAPGHTYGYKSLTLPSHRGRHLQERIVWEIDRGLTAQGHLYNIDYIRTHNYPSLVADRRYGNEPVGYAGYFRWFGRVIPFRTRGARARGFELFLPSS